MKIYKLLLLLFIFFMIAITCYLYGDNPLQLIGIILLLFLILGSFILTDKLVFFEPITLFNLYNILGVLGMLYYYSDGFYKSKYIQETLFTEEIDTLFTKAIYYYLTGYLMTLLGYYMIRKKLNLKFEISIKNTQVFKLVINVFLILCYMNFVFIVFKFAGGNVLQYFQNVAVRQHEFTDNGGTTIFYNLGYIAIFLWQFLDFKMNRSRWFFVINFIAVFAIKFSTGRITQTLFFLIAVLAIEYFLRFDFFKKHTKKILSSFSILGVLAILMYFYRLYSSIVFINQANTSFVGFVTEKFRYAEFTESLIEKGNIPNIPIFMKIIDSWGSDVGYFYGSSLVSWIFNFIPMDRRFMHLPPSEIIKELWYHNIQGGALPPTGYGEMYANFGFMGIVFGMFFFGLLMAYTYNLLRKYNNMWYLLIFVNISVFFFSIYPKGEFDNMSLFLILPYLFPYICILVLNHLFSSNTAHNEPKGL